MYEGNVREIVVVAIRLRNRRAGRKELAQNGITREIILTAGDGYVPAGIALPPDQRPQRRSGPVPAADYRSRR